MTLVSGTIKKRNLLIPSETSAWTMGFLVAGMAAMAQRHLRFVFDLVKTATAIAYFAHRRVNGLTKLKAVKLLYLADQQHLFRYGRPITGDRYIAMKLGPVPEGTLQVLSSFLQPDEVDDPAREVLMRHLDTFQGAGYSYPLLQAKTKPNLDVFSDSDVEVLDDTIQQFGGYTGKVLVDMTHEHNAYKHADAGRAPNSSVELPYEYFFEDAPDGGSAIRQLVESEQEDRDFASALKRAGEQA